MAVKIVVEEVLGGETIVVPAYITDTKGRDITPEEVSRADEVDQILEENLLCIKEKMESSGLIKPGKVKNTFSEGALKGWFEVGKELSFIDNLPVREQERDLLYRAIFDHLHWIEKGKADREHPYDSHYSKCRNMSKLPWKKVKAIGIWSQWEALIGNAMFRRRPPDLRLMDWLYERVMEDDDRIKEWPINKSRLFNTNLRRAFKKSKAGVQAKQIDTKAIPDEELFELFENVANKTHSEYQA